MSQPSKKQKNRKSSQLTRRTKKSLGFENLEYRRLMAGSIELNSDVLTITGTSENDAVTVQELDGGQVKVEFSTNGGVSETQYFQKSSVAKIQFDGLDGNDYFLNETSINSSAYGGNGNDTLIGGSGDDSLFGENGIDDLVSNKGGFNLHDDGEGLRELVLFNEGAHHYEEIVVHRNGNDQVYVEGIDYGHVSYSLRPSSPYYGNSVGNAYRELNGYWNNIDQITFHGTKYGDAFANETSIKTVAYGNGGNDSLFGGSGNDTLYGGEGDDLLNGQGGNDLAFGEAGRNLIFSALGEIAQINNGQLSINGTSDNDGFDVKELSNTEPTRHDVYHNVDLAYGKFVSVTDHNTGNTEIYSRDHVNSIYFDGGAGNDFLRNFTSLRSTLIGGAGNDYLRGGQAADNIHGGDGNDLIFGGEGNDTLWGNAGHDFIFGENGADWLYGGDGNDTLVTGPGNSLFSGGFDTGNGTDVVTNGDKVTLWINGKMQ